MIIPHNQQLGETWHLGHFGDDSEEALHSVVGEDDGREALGLWWDQWEEEGVAHAAPLLQGDREAWVMGLVQYYCHETHTWQIWGPSR